MRWMPPPNTIYKRTDEPVNEVCVCNNRELYNQEDPQTRGMPTDKPRYDGDDYLLCPWCGLLERTYLQQLAQCDTCDKFFKGFKKYPKIRYTCPDCEEKLND